MIQRNRELSELSVAAGESRITDLSDAELRELFSTSVSGAGVSSGSA